MAYAQFGRDRNWEGYIRVWYGVSQSSSGNYSDVDIYDVEFQSIERRTATWTVCGDISISGSGSGSGEAYFEYWRESFSTYGGDWVSLGDGRSDSFRVYHDASGNGSFTVTLYSAGNYNDFNVFHPNGGTYNCEYDSGTSISVTLPRIDTSGPTISLSASVNSSGTVTLSASANVSCNSWAYCIDGSGTWYAETGTAYSKTFTIPNMTGSHSFQVRAVKASNGITGYSSTATTTTPTLGWNKSSTSTDSSIALSVSYLPANTTVRIKYGSTQLDSYSWGYAQNTTINFSASQLKAFFSTAGVTTLQSITVTASVDGYSYTETNFTLTAGSNMAPVVGTPTVAIDQTSQPEDFPNTWIAGISKAKVAATVTSGSNSSISTVILSYGSNSVAMAYNSTTQKYEATTPGTLTGNTVFTVTATDTRGLTGSNSYSLTGVQSYSLPAITIDEGATFRCDADGNKQSGGLFVRVKAAASIDTRISGNALSLLKFYVEEDGSGSKTDLVNNVQSEAVALVNPDRDDAFHIIIEAQDLVSGIVQKRMQMPSGHRDFAMVNFYSSAAGERRTAIGIGMAPEVYPYMSNDTIQLPEYAEILIGGQPMHTMNYYGGGGTEGLLFQKDFLMVDTSTPYAMQNATAAFDKPASDSGWSNIPSSKVGVAWGGIREVLWVSGSCIMVKIVEFYPYSGVIWTNYYNGSAWAGWRYNS